MVKVYTLLRRERFWIIGEDGTLSTKEYLDVPAGSQVVETAVEDGIILVCYIDNGKRYYARIWPSWLKAV